MTRNLYAADEGSVCDLCAAPADVCDLSRAGGPEDPAHLCTECLEDGA